MSLSVCVFYFSEGSRLIQGSKLKMINIYIVLDFSGSSAGKESTCNAGDPSLIPGLGNSPGKDISYPFQYS